MDRFSFSFLGKTAIRKTGNSLVVPDIHHPGPTPFPHSLACNPDLSKSARSVLRIRDHVSTFWVSRNQCHDVRTLLLAKELVGNREVSRRFDNRLHNSLVLHWTPSVKYNCMPLDTNVLRRLRMRVESDRGGGRLGGRQFQKQIFKTHALKGSPNLIQTTTCTSSLLHARHNKINEMPTRHRSGCPEGARNPASSRTMSLRFAGSFACNAKESFGGTIQHAAFFRLALKSICNDLTGLGWLRKYFKSR
jgi:hypothetical protein